jgi:hypothetical protein
MEHGVETSITNVEATPAVRRDARRLQKPRKVSHRRERGAVVTQEHHAVIPAIRDRDVSFSVDRDVARIHERAQGVCASVPESGPHQAEVREHSPGLRVERHDGDLVVIA